MSLPESTTPGDPRLAPSPVDPPVIAAPTDAIAGPSVPRLRTDTPRPIAGPDAHWLPSRVQPMLAFLLAVFLAVQLAVYVSRQRAGPSSPPDSSAPRTAVYQIDINTCTWQELAVLPSLGETMARRIIADRDANGPFASHAELSRVRGIGPAVLGLLVPHLKPIPPANDL